MKKISMIIIFGVSILSLIYTPKAYAKIFAVASGIVKSEDGKPIEGAKVILIFSQDGSKHELATDNKGKWRKANLFPGMWTIGFIAEGFEPQNVTVELSAIKENKPIEIKLSRIPESPLSKGDALYQQGKYTEALQEYKSVLEENQEIYEAYEKIGLCYYRLGDLDKAVEAFKQTLTGEPLSPVALINLSAIYFHKGNIEEGMRYFNKLDAKTIKDPSLFYNIGVLLFKNNQVDEAIDYLSKSIELDSNYIEAYYQLALTHLNKGNIEEAKKSFQKVIELAPESEKAILAKKLLGSIKQ